MKKLYIILTLVTGFLVACQENKFEDYDYTAAYFPNQYPIRTFDVSENTNSNDYKFLIPAVMGGIYKNNKDRVLQIEIAPELCSGASFQSTNNPICLMPSTYYSLSSSENLIIPAGEFYGNIEVQLKNAFFDDPMAGKLCYVIPIRIKSSMDLDSVLSGKSSLASPDPRVASQWSVAPKNFTMFAVKYMSQYQGNYYHRGKSTVKDQTGKVVENNIYRTSNVTNNDIWSLTTSGKTQVSVSSNISSKIFTGSLLLDLSFNNNGSGTVVQTKDSPITASGTCTFLKMEG